MTTLQKQLAALRSTRINELDLKAQRTSYSKSLLFEPSVAVTQSLDTVFQICYEGFEELCGLDHRFTKYQRTIFSPHSKTQDRNVMTEKENEDLTEVLEAFLAAVGARLQLKPAQKAVEWLVRRFRVHELNTESFVLSFTPYHATPLFKTMLSILPTNLPPTLRFLNRYINALQNPPREVLVQAAVQNPAFFNMLNQYVLKVSRQNAQYPLLLSVWARVMVQAVDGLLSSSASSQQSIQQQREEGLYARLFPILNEAMAMKKVQELVLGCFMIIVVLVGKTDLSDEVLTGLMKAVCRSWTGDTYSAGLSCLAQIAEQRGAHALPGSVTRAIVSNDMWAGRLTAISKQQPVDALTIGLAMSLSKTAQPDQWALSRRLVEVVLDGRLLTDAAEHAFRSLLSRRTTVLSESAVEDANAGKLIKEVQRLLSWNEHISEQEALSGSANAEGEDMDDALDEEPPRILAGDMQSHETEIEQLDLPHDLITFLAEGSTEHYLKALNIFEKAMGSREGLISFVRAPLFAAQDGNQHSLLSFLVRTWCSARSPVSRTSALRICLHGQDTSNLSIASLDYVTKFTLVALRDEVRQVRLAAVQLLKRVSASLDGSDANNDPASMSSLHPLDSMKQAQVKPLLNQDLRAFISVIVDAGLDECASDAARIGQVLKVLLGNSSTDQQKHSARHIHLKSSQKSGIYEHLCSVLPTITVLAVRLPLLALLNKVDKVAGKPRSRYLLPLLRQYVDESRRDNKLVPFAKSDLGHSEALELLNIAHQGDDEALIFLLSLGTERQSGVPAHLQSAAFATIQHLWPHIHSASQQSLAVSLLSAAVPAPGSHVEDSSRELSGTLLRSLRLRTQILKRFMEDLMAELAHNDHHDSKRRRTTEVAPTGKQTTHSHHLVPKMTLILELVDSLPEETDIDLFHSTFKILPEIHKVSTQVSSELSYITTLALGCLASAMQSISQSKQHPKIDTSVVRADFLVDCVRTTTSAQARNSALLLVSMLVKQAPQLVLHSVMPLFTMMSSTTARQSDDFSAHVVHQTIQSIVPVLSQKLHEQRKDLISSTAEILVSFAAAYEHIPPQRRLQLFALLGSSLGSDQSLFAIVATLVDYNGATHEILRFVSTLFMQYGTSAAMSSIEKYLDLVADGMKQKPTLFLTLSKQEYVGSAKDSAIVQHLRTISSLLQSSSFRNMIRHDLKVSSHAEALRRAFVASFEKIIAISHNTKGEIQAETARVLDDILMIFPFEIMATTVEPLFDHSDQAMARTALRTIEHRVRSMKKIGSNTRQAMMGLLPRLTTIVTSSDKADTKSAALACIDCICEKFGKSDPDATLLAMQAVASQHCLSSGNSVLETLSLQCLASAIEVLGNESIPLLQPSTDAAAVLMQESLSHRPQKEQLHNASFAFYSALIDHLPFMMSKAMLANVLRNAQQSAEMLQTSAAAEARTQFMHLTSLKGECSIVVQAVSEVWEEAVGQGSNAVHELIALVQALIEVQVKSVVARNARDISALFLKMLDLRRMSKLLSKQYPSAVLEQLNSRVHQGFLAYVLKINDAAFRPFFSQLLEWSSTPSPQHELEGRALRAVAVFEVIRSLSDRLKSIFTSYFNNLVPRAAEILADTQIAGETGNMLRVAVLGALTSSFKHDQDDFWQAPARFDAIVGPLASQLSSTNVDYVQHHVITAITEFASAASASENHKALNSILLKHFRADSAKVRLAAVKCQESLADRLGDDWLSNLPEMLPFINELQEDDDELVEKETHRWIKIIEGILGESLSSMLQ